MSINDWKDNTSSNADDFYWKCQAIAYLLKSIEGLITTSITVIAITVLLVSGALNQSGQFGQLLVSFIAGGGLAYGTGNGTSQLQRRSDDEGRVTEQKR